MNWSGVQSTGAEIKKYFTVDQSQYGMSKLEGGFESGGDKGISSTHNCRLDAMRFELAVVEIAQRLVKEGRF